MTAMTGDQWYELLRTVLVLLGFCLGLVAIQRWRL